MILRTQKLDVRNLWLCVSGLVAFPVYWRTLAPTLQVADAGEQIAAAHFLGVSHPTGTPLYLLLLKSWEWIFPFGTIVWRANFLNVVLSTLTIVLLSSLILRVSACAGAPKGRSLFLALSLSAVLSFSQTYWYESLAASSYVLHYFFVALWLSILSTVILEKRYGGLSPLYLVTGLALANHVLSLVLLVLVLWYSLSLAVRKEIHLKQFAVSSLLLLPGLSLYLYIPLRAAAGPLVNWGRPDSLERFLHYITRRDHMANVYVAGAKDFVDVGLFHVRSFFWDLSPALPFLAVASGLAIIWAGRRKRLRGQQTELPRGLFQLVLVGIAVFIINLLFLSLHGSHLDLFFLKRYMEPGYMGLFFSCAVLIVSFLAPSPRRVFLWFVPLLVLMPLASLYLHFEENDRSQNRLLDAYVKQVFAHLPEGATFYAIGDNHLFPVLYYHLVEGIRPDLTLFNPKLGINEKSGGPLLPREGGFFSSHYIKTDGPITFKPVGLVFKASKGDGERQEVAWREFSQEELGKARAPLEKILLAEYYYRRSVYHEERDEQAQRVHWIRRMESVAGGYDQTLMLTGRAFARAGMVAEAIRYFEAALRVNPKNKTARFLLDRQRGNERGGLDD